MATDPASAASPLTRAPDGVRLALRLTPKASRERIDGLAPDAQGGVALKVQVTAVPEGGKANAALIRLLAKTWRLPKTAFTVVLGATDRNKVLHIAGDPARLATQIEEWIARHG